MSSMLESLKGPARFIALGGLVTGCLWGSIEVAREIGHGDPPTLAQITEAILQDPSNFDSQQLFDLLLSVPEGEPGGFNPFLQINLYPPPGGLRELIRSLEIPFSPKRLKTINGSIESELFTQEEFGNFRKILADFDELVKQRYTFSVRIVYTLEDLGILTEQADAYAQVCSTLDIYDAECLPPGKYRAFKTGEIGVVSGSYGRRSALKTGYVIVESEDGVFSPYVPHSADATVFGCFRVESAQGIEYYVDREKVSEEVYTRTVQQLFGVTLPYNEDFFRMGYENDSLGSEVVLPVADEGVLADLTSLAIGRSQANVAQNLNDQFGKGNPAHRDLRHPKQGRERAPRKLSI